MTIIRPAALDWLETTAAETGVAERELRQTFAREIERLETERRRAFRRYNFLAALVVADAEAADREASHAAQRAAALDELGWDGDEANVLEAMAALSDAVHDERLLAQAEAAGDALPAEPVSDAAPAERPAEERASALLFALTAFEQRFEEIKGKPLVAEFDRTFPETPLVDF